MNEYQQFQKYVSQGRGLLSRAQVGIPNYYKGVTTFATGASIRNPTAQRRRVAVTVGAGALVGAAIYGASDRVGKVSRYKGVNAVRRGAHGLARGAAVPLAGTWGFTKGTVQTGSLVEGFRRAGTRAMTAAEGKSLNGKMMTMSAKQRRQTIKDNKRIRAKGGNPNAKPPQLTKAQRQRIAKNRERDYRGRFS